MIREAVKADIPAIVAMGEKFHEVAGLGEFAEFVPADFKLTAIDLMNRKDAILLVIDQEGTIAGMVGVLMYPHYFNKATRTAQELFWWVSPEFRGEDALELKKAAEERAAASAAGSFIMLALAGLRDEALARLYRRDGYKPLEHSFIRKL